MKLQTLSLISVIVVIVAVVVVASLVADAISNVMETGSG
jgi:hypothetical protein